MSEKISITINEKIIEANDGDLLIDKLFEQEINLQHFCYHPALGVDGNCRMCMVEIEGSKRPQIACNTPVKNGMVVRTIGENIEQVRKDILELELINHPVDCPVCDQAGECSLQDFYMESGFYDSRMDVPKNHGSKSTDLGKNVMLDQERCVMCTRCVRFTRDITKSNELGVEHRADHSVITTFPGMKLQNDYSMNVVDLCPVGALTNKDFRFNQRVWFMQTFDGICSGCSRGCNVYVDHAKEKYKDDKIFRLRPRYNEDINGYFMCDEGRLSYKREEENRLLTPFINNTKSDEPSTLESVIEGLKKYDKPMIILSPMLSLEEINSMLKFAEELDAKVSGYSLQHKDDSFKDEMLKTNDKSPNTKALENLNINQSKEYFENSLESTSLVLVCDNTIVEQYESLLDDKKVIIFSPHKYSLTLTNHIQYPIASFFEKGGTYINCDGISQKVTSGISKDTPYDDLVSLERKLSRMLKGS